MKMAARNWLCSQARLKYACGEEDGYILRDSSQAKMEGGKYEMDVLEQT
jgi:hypothetical protein